jgi:geranylgeranyl diphosphate synthase type I
MNRFFQTQKETISEFLTDFLRDNIPDVSRVSHWGSDTMERLLGFTIQGKMLRGGLLMLGYRLSGGMIDQDALPAAAAMELFQSSFLVHDDIMDRDSLRRGKPTVFWQYKTLAEKGGLSDPYHAGESLGLCAGDISFFLGFELLSRICARNCTAGGLLSFCAREITYVGLAQMEDVWFGYAKELPSEETVLSLYTYKTGRYTFSMPLMAGALIAGRTIPELSILSKLGEKLGVIFQIKDDELGLFGDEKELGKPVGSDLKEGKKTPYAIALFREAKDGERERLLKIFGNPDITPADVRFVQELAGKLGIRERLAKRMEALAAETRSLIASLADCDVEALRVLTEFVEYNLSRSK